MRKASLVYLGIACVLALFLFLNSTYAEYENAFNDTSQSKSFGVSGHWSNITYIKLPRSATVSNAVLNISSSYSATKGNTFNPSETVNFSSGLSWDEVEIEVDSNGDVHLAVAANTGSAVHYFKRTNGVWGSGELVYGDSDNGEVGIAIDSNGIPHVCFVEEPFQGFQLGYANRTGGSWSYVSVPTAVEFTAYSTCAIDIDSLNNIGIISLLESSPRKIEYFFKNGTNHTWSGAETIFNDNPSIAELSTTNRYDIHFNSTNDPSASIFRFGSTDQAYIYSRYAGGNWASLATNIKSGTSSGVTFQFDTNDKIHAVAEISTSDAGGDNLTYSNNTDGTFTTFAVDFNQTTFTNSIIALFSDNSPAILAGAEGAEDLLNYYYFDGSWNNITIATPSGTKINSDLKIDSNGVSYVVFTNGTTIVYFDNGDSVNNLTLDISNDGDLEFNATGQFSGTNTTENFASEITTYLSTCTADAQGFCDVPINISGVDGQVTLDSINITFTEFPRVNITYPINGTTYTSSQTELNYTAYDFNLSTCWYTLDKGDTNTTVTCGENVTGLNSGEGDFTWIFYANDTDNNINSSSVRFIVALQPPNVTLNYPPNNTFLNTNENIYLNYTATDDNGIANCSVYHNLNGSFSLNQTNTGVISNQQNFTILNASSDGQYIWNVECTDTTNSMNFSQNNFTFTTDTTKPVINTIDITTTQGSQTVDFNVTSFTEINCFSAWYSVYDSSGAIENSIENVSLQSCDFLNSSFTVAEAPPSSFNLTVYMNDSAGNENSTTQEFSISQVVVPAPSGGGGGGLSITGAAITVPAVNFSLTTINYQNTLDAVLAKGSVRPRKFDVILTNRRTEDIDVQITCSPIDITQNNSIQNITEQAKSDICDYVFFSRTNVTVSPNELSPEVIEVLIFTPEDAEFSDEYLLNIYATSLEDNIEYFSKLSVQVRVPYWGLFYKWSAFLGQELETPIEAAKSEDSQAAFPVFWISFIGATILAALTITSFTFARKKEKRLPASAFAVGSGVFFVALTCGVLFL